MLFSCFPSTLSSPSTCYIKIQNKVPEFKTSTTNMSTDKCVEKRYDDIIKSQNDDRLYRGLLLSNKMKVVLISDPTTDRSAVTLDVNIGHMCDPDDLPGLAHVCEHMLSLGTKKYPQENDYAKYLTENGGKFNAMVDTDHTSYFFDITPEKLEDVLDRFAQFFIAPLFRETMIESTINIINLEYEKHLRNDTWRFKQLNRSSASADHPFSKFNIGNRQTLDTIPKQKGINVRDRLLEFYEKYYSANMMSLCVLGKESLDELENMVVNLFCEIRNNEIESPVWTEHPFKDEHFGTIWYIVPIRNMRFLVVWFPLPDLQNYYRSSPADYVSYLLGSEKEGSLLSALKAKYWCTSLKAEQRKEAKGIRFLTISVDLTQQGMEHIKDIVQMIFQYINMLKLNGPVERIYNEYRDIKNIDFRFKEKGFLHRYVYFIARSLHAYPMKEVLCAENIITEWQPDLIREVIKYLTPEKIRIHIESKAYENIAKDTERWYGTKYKKEKVSKEAMDMWNNAGYNSDLKLPSKNEFIATKFDIKSETNIEAFPIILEDNAFIKLWYKKDNEFLVPKAKMIFNFVSPFAYMDPVNTNFTQMFIDLFRDSLSEEIYNANSAGLQWNFRDTKYGIKLYIEGYDSNQRVLLEKIMDQMINFKVDPIKFETLKNNYIGDLIGFANEDPLNQTYYYLQVLLTAEQTWLKDELLKFTAYLTAERVQRFISQLLSKVHVEGLIYGNVTKLEAIDIGILIKSKMNKVSHKVPFFQQHLKLKREIKLEDNYHFLFEAENKVHEKSCTMIYYQIGLQSTESNMLLELLEKIISEPCSHILRTKEQLAYTAYSDVHRTINAQGFQVVVESDKHPQYVERRINSFMNSMLDHIATMPEEQFEKYKKAVAVLRLEKPKTLKTQCSVYWSEIRIQQYNFDRENIEISYLKTITQQQLLNFYKENVLKAPKLSIHVIPSTIILTEKDSINYTTEKIADSPMDQKIKKIDDIMSFKDTQVLYPLLKPFKEYSSKDIFSSKLEKK
ncbi:hypothetical protein P5V15_014529 [Pogonomyrmex californicus]